MKRISLFLLPVLILTIGYAGFQYLVKTKSQDEPLQVEEPTWLVTVMPVMRTVLSPTVVLYGRVESPRAATLRTPNQSNSANVAVQKVAVLEGNQVTKGQVLIRLAERDSQLQLKQREADLADIEAQLALEKQRYAHDRAVITHEENLLKLTQRSLERIRALNKQKISSESAIDDAQQAVERQLLTVSNRRFEINNHSLRLTQLQAKRDRALAQRDLARLELERNQIMAPFTGIISEVFIAEGDRVRSGDSLLSLYDNTALEIRAQIPNRYQGTVLDAIANRQPLLAHTQIHEHTVHMQLDRTSGQISQNSGGIDGLFRVTSGSELLRLNQFVTLLLTLPPQSRVIALPFEAIYGGNRVYKLVEGRMKGVTIEKVGEYVAPNGQSQILIRSSALTDGEKIIVTQLPNAMEGLKVQVKHQ